ncbi:MAG TPA: CDGSH iron-sulfur domain-containing protein [Solirubrobacteraceae bacterium]|jgi:3-phenylpropionate/trans-cinnamate dioxygenase ferredoxin subunit|nr:CDGSH iron-sulfur domain-containing protein [Solirubrobacteraceae bacterium]
MSDVQITILENGPYEVKGAIDLVGHDGTPVETRHDTVYLCRCGGSTNKPFCDGTHSKIGFQGAMKAVDESGD